MQCAGQVKDAHHRGIVAKYCAKDCELVYRLIQRLDILPQYLEMSKVTGPILYSILSLLYDLLSII